MANEPGSSIRGDVEGMSLEKELKERLATIQPLKKEFFTQAQERLDQLTKPRGSLGQLEEIAKRYVAIVENIRPRTQKKMTYTFAGDHGAAPEGVSAYPKDVTPQMVYNFLRQGAAINVLAGHAGAKVVVVDIGVDHLFEP